MDAGQFMGVLGALLFFAVLLLLSWRSSRPRPQ